MLTFAWYLLKVMLCSAILLGYYWVALRNKKFHVYNRFYLLASVVLSWVIPLIKIELWKDSIQQPQVIKLLAVVAGSNSYVEEAEVTTGFIWNWEMVMLLAFAFISVVFLTKVIITIVRISLLISGNPKQKWNDIYFVFSNAKGTPFSFFKFIFWNEYIDLNTAGGEQILKHELVHVYEKHSADKMFLNLLLTVGWYNPFMWLICKELNLIHEFIADEKTMQNGDVTTFASTLLKAAYPRYLFPLTNSFFYSPVKRRLLMLTTSKKTSYSYLRRLAILPLLMLTCAFFAFQIKEGKIKQGFTSIDKDSIVTKIYGLEDSTGKPTFTEIGIRMEDGKKVIYAKDKNGKTEIFEKEAAIKRFGFKEEDVDKWLSMRKDTTKKKERKLNGSNDSTIKFSNVTLIDSTGRESQISAEITFSNKDSEMLKKELIILDGQIITWGDVGKINSSLIKSIDLLKVETAIKKFGEKGKNGVLEITTLYPDKYKAEELNYLKDEQNNIENQQKYNDAKQEYLVNQQKLLDEQQNLKDQQDFLEKKQKYLQEQSASGSANKQKAEQQEYLKKRQQNLKDQQVFLEEKQKYQQEQIRYNKVFTRVENPPFYPKGMKGFADYISSNMQYPKEAIQNKIEGAVLIQFIVSDEGKLTDFKKLSGKGYGLEEEAIRLIKNSGDWKPGLQNGHKVPVQIEQQVIFQLPGKS